jgi:hypothetical protein
MNFDSPKTRYKIKIILAILPGLLLIVFMSSCAGTGGYQKAEFINETPEDVILYGNFDKEYASKYFGRFRFVFENQKDQW